MYGARPTTDFDVTACAAENARLAELLREARVAFEFLCATWPEVFLGQAHAAFARIGVRVRPPDAHPLPPQCDERAEDDARDEDEEGGCLKHVPLHCNGASPRPSPR